MPVTNPTPRIPQSQQLLDCAAGVGLFCSREGQPFARFRISSEGGHLLWPLRSSVFRSWLINRYDEIRPDPARSHTVRDAIRTLEARAFFNKAPLQRIGRRISPFPPDLESSAGPGIVLDLHDGNGQVVEIGPTGWRVEGYTDSCIAHGPSALPLPMPRQSPHSISSGRDPLHTLAAMFSFPSAQHWHRCLAWLLAALRPQGPYPILIISGPAGSGKSTLARFLRHLVDPSLVPFSPLPGNADRLLRLAWDHWVLAFDHVSKIPQSAVDSICRVASGGGFILPDSARDRVPVNICRPIILTGSSSLAQHPDLASLALHVELTSIGAARRRPESALQADFAGVHATALGALCNALSIALSRVGSVHVPAAPRLADLAYWTAAAAPAVAVTEREFLAALDPAGSAPSPDLIVDAVRGWMSTQPSWSGSATELLAHLRGLRVPGLPLSAKGLSQYLNKMSHQLHSAGIHVQSSRLSGTQRVLKMTHHA